MIYTKWSDNDQKTTMKDELKPGARKVIRWFEATVLACMGIVILSGLLSAIVAQKQFEAFDGNCIYTSNMSFILRNATRDNKQHVTTPNPDDETTDGTGKNASIETTEQTPPARSRRAKKIKHIFKSLETEYIDEDEDYEEEKDSENKVKIEIDRSKIRKKDDYEFLTAMQVDTIKTNWAQIRFCEYVLYNPLLSSIAGMVCVTMLILFNAAGKSSIEWGIPQPWRIVFPAVISFSIMTIVSAVHLVLMNRATEELCAGLSLNLTQKNIQCDVLIESLQPIMISDSISIGNYFIIHMISIKVTLAAWIIALIIMVLRMFFVIDFRLVRVTISTFSQHSQKSLPSDVSSSESGELEEKSEQLHSGSGTKLLDPNMKARTGSSPDDLDDFQSAYSDPDGATMKQPTSLEPLIGEKKED